MSNQYAGGFISKTPPTVTTSSAQGMWTLSQQAQYQKQGVWPVYVPPPTTIGQAYGGGYYAGKISTAGTGVADYYLIVAPKATGESSSKTWGVYGVSTSATSVINGRANSDAINNASYPAAYFCRGLSIGGYSDWYLPAKNELEVLYYFLKPVPNANDTSSGSNANAVSPEPISTNYTSGSPAQTTATSFISSGSECFEFASAYWSSTEYDATSAWYQGFRQGDQSAFPKNDTTFYTRAVRRVPV